MNLIHREDRAPVRRKAAVDAFANLVLMPMKLMLTKRLIDSLSLYGNPGAGERLLFCSLLLAAVLAASAFVTSSSLLMHTRINEIGHLRTEHAIVEKTIRLPLRLIEAPATQNLRSQALKYAPDEIYLEALSLLLQGVQSALLLAFLCWTGYWPLAAGLLLYGGCQGWFYVKTDARMVRASRDQTARFRLADHLHKQLIARSAAQEMRIFGLGTLLQRHWETYYRTAYIDNERLLVRNERSKLFPELSFALLGGAAIVAVILMSTKQARSAGDYVLLFQCIALLAGSIPLAVKQAGNWMQLAVRGDDFAAYCALDESPTGADAPAKADAAESTTLPYAAEPPAETDAADARAKPAAAEPPGLLVDRMSFRYDDCAYGRPALQEIGFRIAPGTTTAIVGENGSGKSTLAKLLLGLYEPDEGTVRWTTRQGPVEAGDPACRAAAVFQDFSRYRLSVRANVGVGDISLIHDDPAIGRALARAGIGELTELLDETIGTEFGRFDLSGGQWQKIAAARAYMRGGCLIVFDEPTSALDPKAEQAAFADLLQAAAGQTAILVTHRLGAAKLADRILVLKDGRLAEQGSHAELLARAGEYARLYDLQAAWYA